MDTAIKLLRSLQPKIRIMLTASPAPITATASGRHVIVANSHSKSVLRRVTGELCGKLTYCDYFPSYEMVTAPPFRSMFYSSNI